MIVRELWRYPVKSLGGEPLEALEVDERGVAGDRLWALVDADGKLASGKDSRRFHKVPGLLMHAVGGEGFAEDAWLGRTLAIGDVVLRGVDRTERCVMVNHARPGIDARSDVPEAIGRANGACAGVYAEVVRTGTIEINASARLLA